MQQTIYRGGCLCGRVRYEATGPAEKPHTCSCTMCQRHTGTLTAAWVEFPRERVNWTGPGGMPSTFRSSDYSSRAFCPHCGSSIGALDDEPTVALLLGWVRRQRPGGAYADVSLLRGRQAELVACRSCSR